MNITSMSNRELYKTLTGYDYPHGAGNTKPVELTDTIKGESVDISKAIALSEEANKFELQAENPNKTERFDRFEPSVSFDLTQLPQDTSKDYFARANDIDFSDKYTNMVIQTRSLMATCNGGSVPTKESIAEYYGKMAKRLDEAYAEGKFTKEEYDYLNEGIAEHMEHAAECAEETAAFFEVGHDRSMSLQSFEKRMSMTREERKADLKAEISEYIEKYFKIDRTALMQLFNSFRFGK